MMKNKIFGFAKKIKNLSPAAKASMALVFARFFQKGLGFISAPIFTRIMPQAEYGLTSTFTSWQSVLLIVTTLNMSSGVFNNGMIDFKEDRNSFMASILCLANIVTIIWFAIYFIFQSSLDSLIALPQEFMVVMALYFVFVPAYNYWMGRQRFEYKYKGITVVLISSSLISTAASIFFVILAPEGSKANAKVLTSELVTIIIGIVCYISIFIKSRLNIKTSYWRYALLFNLPLIPHYLSMYVLSSSDRIMITKLVGSEYTAIYNLAYTVASVMLIFWNSIDAAYTPWIYENMKTEKFEPIRSRGNQLLFMFSSLTVFCSLFAPDIISILGPSSYKEGAYAVPIVAAGVFFTACYTLFMRIELYLKKTKPVMIFTVFSAALNLVLNYFGIKMFGYMAAAYTTLLCYCCLAVLHSLYLSKIGYKNIYDYKVIGIMSVAVILFSHGVMVTYQVPVLRYILILALLIFIVIKRSFFIDLIKGGR